MLLGERLFDNVDGRASLEREEVVVVVVVVGGAPGRVVGWRAAGTMKRSNTAGRFPGQGRANRPCGDVAAREEDGCQSSSLGMDQCRFFTWGEDFGAFNI